MTPCTEETHSFCLAHTTPPSEKYVKDTCCWCYPEKDCRWEKPNACSFCEKEHESFLYVHRENMKAIERIADLKKALGLAVEALEKIGQLADRSGHAYSIGVLVAKTIPEIKKVLS